MIQPAYCLSGMAAEYVHMSLDNGKISFEYIYIGSLNFLAMGSCIVIEGNPKGY